MTPPHRRRFPHIGDGDLEILAALPTRAARIFENELQAQHRRERRFRAHETTEAALGDDALEQLHARRESRWSHGPGGGRRAPAHPTAD